jgi:hypothetical protein
LVRTAACPVVVVPRGPATSPVHPPARHRRWERKLTTHP